MKRSGSQSPGSSQGADSSTSGSSEAIAASDRSASRSSQHETVLRFMIALSGMALVVCGTVAAFMVKDGVATAALVAAGFGLLFVSYLGQYITRVRFRDFEAELDHFREKAVASLQVVEDRAAEAVNKLEEVSRSYESIRATMIPGGTRDRQMEDAVAAAMRLVRTSRISHEEVKKLFHANGEGDRILVLAAMKVDPDLRDFEIILEIIQQPRSPFEQDRFMLLACEILGNLNAEERSRLRETVEHLRETARIKPTMARWFTSERLFHLLERIERNPRDQ